ncbi:MAG: polysaccharide deacetylase family protein [Actinobacteria bacterium]|nr:MAG: polysaccharide deacetylase family protein [Actinomycetota bacterium]
MSEPGSVALTFDAEHPDRSWCPPGAAERILDVLAGAGIRATFFIQGRWAEAYPGTARRIADEGHLVGNHSHHHARMPLLLDRGLREDVDTARGAIIQATGRDPRPWFRCPWGTGADDPRVLAALAAAGYRHVGWHVEVEDWEPTRSSQAIAADAIEGIRRHGDGTVLLLHTWPGGTVEALQRVLDDLPDGTAFITVDALAEVP